MKSVLLYANEDSGLEARLQMALDAVRLFDGHLTCLQVTPLDAMTLGDPFIGSYSIPTVLDEVRRGEEAHRTRIEDRLRREGIPWIWVHCDGGESRLVVSRARLSDLIVLNLPGSSGHADDAPAGLVGDVAIQARAPVLAVPHEGRACDLSGTAIVAWNGSAESAHAIRLSLPILKRASAVHLITVTEDRTEFPAVDACEYLSRQGLRPELHEWPREGRTVADAILDAARVLGGSYILMGAYGHSRMLEAVLGGVTRAMIARSPIPLLLAH